VVFYVFLSPPLDSSLSFYSICTAALCALLAVEAFESQLASIPISAVRNVHEHRAAKERAANRPAMKYQSAGSLRIIIASSAVRALPVATGGDIFMTKRRERRAPTG